jgi:hypothetical protein
MMNDADFFCPDTVLFHQLLLVLSGVDNKVIAKMKQNGGNRLENSQRLMREDIVNRKHNRLFSKPETQAKHSINGGQRQTPPLGMENIAGCQQALHQPYQGVIPAKIPSDSQFAVFHNRKGTVFLQSAARIQRYRVEFIKGDELDQSRVRQCKSQLAAIAAEPTKRRQGPEQDDHPWAQLEGFCIIAHIVGCAYCLPVFLTV